MIVKTLFLLSMLFCFRINAQNIELPIGPEYKAIQFRMNRMDVKFQESTNGKLTIIGLKDKSLWTFNKDSEGVLVVEEKEYGDRLFVSNNDSATKERLVIKLPVLPLQVVGSDLDISLESIKNNVKLIVVKGIVRGFKTQGEVRAFVNSGEIHIDTHSGSLFLNGSQVKFSMKNSSGDAKVNNYGGTITLEKNTEHYSIFNYQGIVSFNQVTGSSQIELNKGSIQIAQSQGRHDILTDEATVDLKATADSDFNVKMKNGKLTFQSSGVTGAWLNLNSKEGEIYLPTGLKPQKVKAEVFFKGRTAGEKSASRLEARSVNAPIIVR